MNIVAVWPAAADGLRSAPDEEVANDVAHTDSSAAHARTGQTGTDVCAHLYDIAFHSRSPYDWNCWIFSCDRLSAADAAHP